MATPPTPAPARAPAAAPGASAPHASRLEHHGAGPVLRVLRVSSSLPLQKLLYFNALFSLAFAAAHAATVAFKLQRLALQPMSQALLPAALGVWAAVELARLWLGYRGNLGEQVPALAAFFLLTLLPQLPLVAWMGFAQWESRLVLPLDQITAALMLAFLALELQ